MSEDNFEAKCSLKCFLEFKLSIRSKLNNTFASIASIKKTQFVDVITKFAVVKGQFINETDSFIATGKFLKGQVENSEISEVFFRVFLGITFPRFPRFPRFPSFRFATFSFFNVLYFVYVYFLKTSILYL